MKMFVGNSPTTQLSFVQSKQASAIMDCIGRLIPQEGVDYEVTVIFSGVNNPNVSLNITALTDKGEMWKDYVQTMIKKYPPVVDFHGEVLPYSPEQPGKRETDKKEEKNEQK